MATPLVNTLSDELDRIAARYEAQFAGQSRATRNLDELDAIIDRTRELVARIDSIPEAAQPRELRKLRETASTNLDLYKRERELIVQAKNAPAELEEFSPWAVSANFVFARYVRHFAGQNRATRDLGLLDEMIADLERVRDGMHPIVQKTKDESLGRDLELVKRNIELYRRERTEIEKARREGTPEERASLFAELANGQFRIYQFNFAGRSRATRRPALLVRMIDQLKDIQKGMRALKASGLSSEPNDRNIGIVQGQLETFERELGEIRKVRKETKLEDLMGLLGGAANEEFAEYRKDFEGKNRTTRNLEKLSDICDRLGEIHRQMQELSRTGPNEMNDRNLEIVTAQLTSFEREWELIKQAKEKG
jgi:hypothetical protein